MPLGPFVANFPRQWQLLARPRANTLAHDDARGLFQLPGLERMADRVELDIRDLRMVGPDLRIIAVPMPGKGAI